LCHYFVEHIVYAFSLYLFAFYCVHDFYFWSFSDVWDVLYVPFILFCFITI
jgi:hypothetical protein